MSAGASPQPFGRYLLLERIAVGGMAEIFKAQYRSEDDFEKTLVIKRILPHLATNDEFINMFRDEAKLTVRLTHANIVQVFDFGKEGSDYYLAMEFVHGQNLRSVISRSTAAGHAELPIPLACYFAEEVAKGLAYAHTRKDSAQNDLNIIHRDVTPSNILVSYEGDVKIADFGIAKAASRTGSTQQGMIKGKAAYLAPEQLTGQPVDARVDVFALGSCLWEMLTGRRLLTGETDLEILGKLASGNPFQKPSVFRPTISPDVDRVVMKALTRDPYERYANAALFQKDLQALVHRMAITSTEVATWMRKLFDAELTAEQSAPIAFVNVAKVAAGVQTEATRTKKSPSLAGTEEQKATKYLHTPLPRPAPETAPKSNRTLLLGAGIGALVLAAGSFGIYHAAGLGLPRVAPTPTPVALAATATVAPTHAVVVAPTPALAVVVATPTPAPTHKIAHATATKAAPAPTAAPATPTPTPIKVAVAGPPGFLSVDSNPSGVIFIDGKSSGRETPAFDIELAPGHHDVFIFNTVSKLATTFSVEIKPGEKLKKGVLQLGAPKPKAN